MKTLRVLIADDHALFVEGLTALLDSAPDIQFVGVASNGAEALQLTEENPDADLLILDLKMPELDGISVAKQLKSNKSTMPILGLTQNDDGGSISRAMKAGMQGYILKTADRDEFVEAIRTVAAGDQYFSQDVRDTLVFSLTGREKQTEAQLTKREKEIIALIANEMTTQEIADKLFLSPYTVETHRKNLIQKLGVRNVAGLVRYAVEHDLVDLK